MSWRLCRILERAVVHQFADGLYKWFRRFFFPAATQAIKTGENISVIYDTGERQIDSSSAYKVAVMQRVAHVSIDRERYS